MSNSKAIVKAFWETMQSNDFVAASRHLAEDYELYWPQSKELIIGRDNFVAVNQNYPAHGSWQFTIHNLIAEGNEVVSDVSVTDGVVKARAITFSSVAHGLIVKQLEFWPDEYEAPEWRRAWVKHVES